MITFASRKLDVEKQQQNNGVGVLPPHGKEAALGLAIVGVGSILVILLASWVAYSNANYYMFSRWASTKHLPPLTKEVAGWFGPTKVPNVIWVGAPIEEFDRLRLVQHRTVKNIWGDRGWCLVVIGTNNTLERLLVADIDLEKWVEVPVTFY